MTQVSEQSCPTTGFLFVNHQYWVETTLNWNQHSKLCVDDPATSKRVLFEPHTFLIQEPMFLRSTSISLSLITALLLTSCSGPSATTMVESTPNTPALALIDGEFLSVSEFETQYSKNGIALPDTRPTQDELLDFLDRYVNFRAKVLEARFAGYHQRDDLIAEIEQYRSQMARPYLLERNVIEPLIQELYDRRSHAVDASHILITIGEGASPSDTLEAYNKLTDIRNQILDGSTFGTMAVQHSMDPSAKGAPGSPGYQGNLGFFGGGRMVKEFEDQAFMVPVDSVSNIFRSQFGYHILKVNDRMPMPSDRKLAHIMIRPRGQTAADMADVDQRSSHVQTQLAEGESFASLALELSDDRNSAQNGGDLGVLSFDSGLPFAFRDAAFALTEIGQTTGPIQTPFGLHFIQLVELNEFGSYEEEYESIKAQVNQLPRSKQAETDFSRTLRSEQGSSIDSMMVRGWVASFTADSLFRTLAQNQMADSSLTFLSLGETKYSVGDFTEWFSENRLADGATTELRILSMADMFLNEKALGQEVSLLEQRDASFGATMKEFRDGLILFRLMEDSVWTAAASDTVGLKMFYEDHQTNYQFNDRVRVLSVSSVSDSLVSHFISQFRENPSMDLLSENQAFTVDTTYVESPSGSLYDKVFEMEENQISDSIPYNRGFIVLIHGGVEPARQMTFKEARALLVGEYQDVVEERLMTRLRAKYGIVTYSDNLSLVFQSDNPSSTNE
jgi:peptidyl-prolyl cis-trans isomerase SurA